MEPDTTTQAPSEPKPAKAAPDATSVLGMIAESIEKLSDRLDRSRITQTDTAAMATAEDVARERHAKAQHADERAAIVSELEAKILQQQAELKTMRESIEFRKSSHSLPEMRERIEQEARVPRAATKMFWDRLATTPIPAGEDGSKSMGGRRAVEVLMNGGLEAGFKSWVINGAPVTIETLVPMTAGSDDGALREAQEANDVVFGWMLWKQGRKEYVRSLDDCPYWPRYKAAMEVLGKAFSSTTITNWIPTGFSARIWERFELQRNLSRFIEFIPMTQNPQNTPVRGTYLTPVRHSQVTTNPEAISSGITTTNPDTLLTTLTLHELAFRVAFSFGAAEDSLPQIIPALMEDLASSKAYWLEQFILNASSAPINHPDTDLAGSATDIRVATADGLRPTALDNAWTTDLSAASAHDVEALETGVGSMGKYGATASGRVFVAGPRELAKLLVLKNSSGHPVVIGSAAPMSPSAAEVKSDIRTILGSPLIVSEAMRENMGTAGHVDGTTSNSWTLACYARRAFALAAMNLQGRFEADVSLHSAQHQMLQWERWEFEDVIPTAGMSATEHSVHLWIGITTTS